jgi:hypothetical protein
MFARVLWQLSVALACALAGCVKAYQAPSVNEPHALLKVRRVYHGAPGSWYQSSIYIGDELLSTEDGSTRPAPARNSATLVRPGAIRVTVGSSFWHTEHHWVSEVYTEDVPYTATETYVENSMIGCPTGVLSCARTATRTVIKYRTETKSRMVWKTVHVKDDDCQRFAVRKFEPNHIYALQYTYAGASHCTITCLEQYAATTAEGSAFKACRVPP